MSRPTEVTTITFKGPRFDDHALDITVLSEFLAYRELLVETAKELWYAANPKKKKLPDGFESRLTLQLREIRPGSVACPLLRDSDTDPDDLPLEVEDEYSKAARIIEMVMDSADRSQAPSSDLPAVVIPLFEKLGKTLRPDEWMEFQSSGNRSPVRWNEESRNRVQEWASHSYTDSVDYIGEVTRADVEGCSFTLKLDSGDRVPGKFSPEQESDVTSALHDHKNVRVRVSGRAEFFYATGKPKRFVDVSSIVIVPETAPEAVPGERPFWEIILEIGSQIPDSELALLPPDGAENHDRYLNGKGRD